MVGLARCLKGSSSQSFRYDSVRATSCALYLGSFSPLSRLASHLAQGASQSFR
jgi:hypothetical protein